MKGKMAYSYKELNLLSDEVLVRMAQEGSSTAYELLIDKYKEMAKNKARNYYINGGDKEDVQQEGMIGIFKAVRDFNQDGGSSFSTFASLCVDRQIQTAITGANREKHRPLNESISLSEGEEQDETDSIVKNLSADKDKEPEKMTLFREAITSLYEEAEKKLSATELSVFKGIMQGKTYKEIARELGKAPKTVDNATQRIKKKIKFTFLDY